MARTEQLDATGRLPNAPLAEVVFEIRWALHGDETIPPPFFRVDPGFGVLVDAFTEGARKLGFPTRREMVPISHINGWQIFSRYYIADNQNFPIFQIGPGIFAANQSSEYDWISFRKLVRQGVELLLRAYPRMRNFPFSPIHIELRYIDVFDEGVIGSLDFIEFTNNATTMRISLPDPLSGIHTVAKSGRLGFSFPVKGRTDTTFLFDYASGIRAPEAPIIRLESKVISTSKGVPTLRRGRGGLDKMDKWLEEAHAITSPFFKSFINQNIMQKFL
jgi:uncharacterized protein (TIGR04255 family)